MKAGAVEFLTKPFREQDLLDAVQIALAKDRSRQKKEQTVAELQARFESLTSRERQIMTLLTMGKMTKHIAAEIGLSEITVKFHHSNLMKKMGASSIVDLVRMADSLHGKLTFSESSAEPPTRLATSPRIRPLRFAITKSPSRANESAY
jgi:FixJ family two-component response regulator